jgi:hypothetical protein
MKNESNETTSDKTTFSTWGRVAEDQLERMTEALGQAANMQGAALAQGRELLAYNLKLANDCQSWASETGKSLQSAFLKRK